MVLWMLSITIITIFKCSGPCTRQSQRVNKVNNLNGSFVECSSLITLPNIPKWNTENVTDISGMLYQCNSLISLPDISKWMTNNVINMYSLFSECLSLKSLPDISKWNTKNVRFFEF